MMTSDTSQHAATWLLLPWLGNGRLPAKERASVEHHVQGCAACARELARHADSFKAAFNLSRLYERAGNREGQVKALRLAIEVNPGFAEGHLFLAKAYLDGEQHLDAAAVLARQGLALDPRGEYAPLGQYVLADIFGRQGRRVDAAQEARRGQQLERAKPKR